MERYRINTAKCVSPLCKNKITVQAFKKYSKMFCIECIKTHKLYILKMQVVYNLPIDKLIIDVCRTYNFDSSGIIAKILGITRSNLDEILKKYFGINSWDTFRRIYRCKSNSCYLVRCTSLFSSKYKNKYYLVKKIKKDFDVCACLYRSKSIQDNVTMLVNIPNESKLFEIQSICTLYSS